MQMPSKIALIACLGLLTAGCGDANTGSAVQAPGAAASRETRLLETGTALLHPKEPLATTHAYPNGFHFFAGDVKLPMGSYRDCSVQSTGENRCVVLDDDDRDAKLMMGLTADGEVEHRALDRERDPAIAMPDLSGLPVSSDDPLRELVLDGLLRTLSDEMSALVFMRGAMPELLFHVWQPFEQPPADDVFHADVGRSR
jgi:hypothetical protein